MKKRLAKVFGAIALMLTGAASMGCMIVFLDEPVAPTSFQD